MKHKFGKTVIVALGGSVVYPEKIDVRFLKSFKRFTERFLKQKIKFVLIVGGGRLSRLFQTAAHEISKMTNEDKDWIGIHATRLNAQLLRTVFRGAADPLIIDARHKIKKLKYPITIASGWKPGWSTDYIAVALAEDFGVPEVVIAGKPDFVYHKDPHKYKNVEPFAQLSWKKYRTLVPKKWIPGSHAPVDPVGAALAEKRGIKAIVIHGKNLKNFENLLNGREFRGTIIQ